MKGVFYIAILFGSLFCDVKVCGDEIHNINSDEDVTTRFHDVLVKSTGNNKVENKVHDDKKSNHDSRSEINSSVGDIDNEINAIADVKDEDLIKSTYEEINNEIGKEIFSTENLDDELYSTEDEKAGSPHETSDTKELNEGTKKGDTLNKFLRNQEGVKEIFSSEEEKNGIHNEILSNDHQAAVNFGDSLNSTTFRTVNHYFCMTEEVEETQLLLYGTKAWTFPLQDVNLTLTYPMAKTESQLTLDLPEDVDNIITGFKVVLYIDGVESRGYITRGGVLQEHISLTFISSGITSLLYKFWLYGTPRHNTDAVELNTLYFLCS